MAGVDFQLYTDHGVDDTNITANGTYDLLTSATQTNSGDYDSLRVVIEYTNFSASGSGTSWNIQAIVESNNGLSGASEKWFPITHQFRSYRGKDTEASTRELILQPDLVVIDQGVDDVVFIGNDEDTRISRVQGRLGDEWRIRFVLTENDHSGSGSFTDGDITVYGERYNASS